MPAAFDAISDPERLTVAVRDSVTEYVAAGAFENARDQASEMRKALVLAHMHLTFGDADAAFAVITRTTGLTVGDARAAQSIVNFARRQQDVPTDA